MSNEEKRRLVAAADTKVAWRQGSLHGKSVYHVVFGKEGEYNHLVLVGDVPEGAVLATGKGSALRSIRLTRGIPPKQPIKLEGGAIDPVVSPIRDRKGVKIDFVPDKSVKHLGRGVTIRQVAAEKEKPVKPRFSIKRRSAGSGRGIDMGADIVRDRRGRHLRL